MDDAARRKVLLRKGLEVARRLEEFMSRKDVDLSQGLPTPLRPDEDPELRLRQLLAQIDRRVKAPRFGCCLVCDERLPDPVLDETPWIERCARHPS